MSTPNKIAVCISGQYRLYAVAIESIIKNLIEPYNCDIYCCFSTDTSNGYNKVSEETIKKKAYACFKDALKGLEIVTTERSIKTGVFTDDMIAAMDEYPCNIHPRNKKKELCSNLRKAYEKEHGFQYDVVMSIRPSFVFKKPFEFSPEIQDGVIYTIGKTFTDEKKGYENIPRVWDGFWYATSSTFSLAVEDLVGSFPSINGIKEDIDELFEKLRIGCFIFGPENTLLYNWVVRHKLKLEFIDIPAHYIHPPDRHGGGMATYSRFQGIDTHIRTNLPHGLELPPRYCIEGLTHLCK